MFRRRANDPNPREGTGLRYAEIMLSFLLSIAGQDFILIRGRWFPSIAQELDVVSQQPTLRANLAWDVAEPVMEATHIESQVVVAPSPYDNNKYMVLDRHYDSMVDMVNALEA